jgi:hypothetical protein
MGLPKAEQAAEDAKNAKGQMPEWSAANGEDSPAAAPPPRNSDHMYAADGFCARLAGSSYFQNTTLLVIVFNAVWIGVDVDWNHPNFKKQESDPLPLEPYSTIIENLFCGYFSIELTVRFLAYRRKCDLFKDNWFIFDGLLVLFMVIETWILAIVAAIQGGGTSGLLSKFSALRLLRLLRLTRMARLMREVPELLTLVKGMINATRAVSFILMFLVLCMYVFAIVFTAQLGNHEAPEKKYELKYWESDSDPTGLELFGSLGDSMMSLFTRGMLADNLAETLQAIKDRGGEIVCEGQGEEGFVPDAEICVRSGGSIPLMWAFVLFMIISAFCLLNMLIGVLCEVIQDSAEKEMETAQLSNLKHEMHQAFELIDTSKDGLITKNEWQQMRTQTQVQASMASLGVEEQHMEERLDQMQESLFGADDDEEEEEGEEGEASPIAPVESSLPAHCRSGLTFDEFIEKVVEIRPDTAASALDIEILRTRVEREEKTFNARLDFIEEALNSVNGTAALPPPKDAKESPVKPVGKAADLSFPAWLADVPTDVLFAVLNSRAPPQLGPPKLLTDSR